jgi:hypothetical protein
MVSEKTVSLEVAIEVVLCNGPTFETIAGLCKMAVEAEREACLKACEQIAAKYYMKRYATDWQAQECIAAIKARGES